MTGFLTVSPCCPVLPDPLVDVYRWAICWAAVQRMASFPAGRAPLGDRVTGDCPLYQVDNVCCLCLWFRRGWLWLLVRRWLAPLWSSELQCVRFDGRVHFSIIFLRCSGISVRVSWWALFAMSSLIWCRVLVMWWCAYAAAASLWLLFSLSSSPSLSSLTLTLAVAVAVSVCLSLSPTRITPPEGGCPKERARLCLCLCLCLCLSLSLSPPPPPPPPLLLLLLGLRECSHPPPCAMCARLVSASV